MQGLWPLYPPQRTSLGGRLGWNKRRMGRIKGHRRAAMGEGGGWRQWVGDRASIIVSRMQMTATGDGPGASISTDCSLPRRHLHHQRRRIAFFPLSLSLSLFLLLFLIPRSSFTFLFLLISFLLFLPHPSSRTEWWRCGRYGPFVSFFSRSMLQRPRRSRGSLVGSGAIAVTR